MSKVAVCIAAGMSGLFALPLFAADVTVDISQQRVPVSPYIWGINQDMPGGENVTARRLGGNRMTGYNWENNASHAGNDYQMNNDGFMTRDIPKADTDKPGATLTYFHDDSLTRGTVSLITLPMAGYVARDKTGPVSLAEVAPSARWDEVRFTKGSAFTATPNLTDSIVYVDEEVAFLVGKYGAAGSARGVQFYSADNEPDIWYSTHPRIHPDKLGCQELVTRTVAFAKAVKAVDPKAEIFGFVSYGWAGFVGLQGAADWDTVKGTYDWFISYFLAEMKKASDAAGMRLLDVLDLHWYPEARGGGVRVTDGDTVNADARVQSPRSLWDPDYIETSWMCPKSCPLRLLPHVQESINKYYPGTKLAITEYSWGAPSHISGGVALADVFGLFAKYGVFMATQWGNAGTYSSAGFKIYRNYDGANHTWGDVEVQADSSDIANLSVHAAVEGNDTSTLHLMLINRNATQRQTANLTITSPCGYTAGRVWGFGPTSATLSERPAIATITGNKLVHDVDAMTVEHIVLTGKGAGCAVTTGIGGTPDGGSSAGTGGATGAGGTTGSSGTTGTGGGGPSGSGGKNGAGGASAASGTGGTSAGGSAKETGGTNSATSSTGGASGGDTRANAKSGCSCRLHGATPSLWLFVATLAMMVPLALRRRRF